MNPVGPYNPYAEKQGLCAIWVFTDGDPLSERDGPWEFAGGNEYFPWPW